MNFKDLYDGLELAMLGDQFRLRRQLKNIQHRQRKGKPVEQPLQQFLQRVEKSQQLLQWRRQNVPTVCFPEELPIAQRWQEIAALIEQHQVVILAGETGSGKTTQLPKICLKLGRGLRGLIGHTQPRRIAARTVAARIAEELLVPLGEQVGYQVRFADHSTEHTHIKLMTDGILLAEIQQSRFLEKYDTLIIDEAHERSLNVDFLLGYLKRLLPKRPDLKLIITSATIDVEGFAKHFEGAPVIEVSGRTYPVEVLYRPLAEEADYSDQPTAIVKAIDELLAIERGARGSTQRGDILVFLSGEREIRETALAVRRAKFPHCEVLPLYARLSAKEQNKVFNLANRRGRRIVLATNVAETSLTVPGIHYVIDPGCARISRYSYRTKVQRLPIEAISQASADQRKGRCGRVNDGICIRLYSQEDFSQRVEFTDAELHRTNLASVILQMLSMKLGEIKDFPFIDPPDARMINDGFTLLEELSAVNPQKQLTALGRQLSKLPVDPRIGRMILAAAKEDCLKEMLIIASALSIQDPRERPADKQQAADEKHRRWWNEQSDFCTLVDLWDYYEGQRQALSQNQLRKLCKREFLSYLRMREWRDIHYQLRLAVKGLGFTENKLLADYAAIHKALLAGLLSHVGFRHEEREYLGARNRKFRIFPGSALAKKAPKWLVAAEMVETSFLYARMVAKIEPEWIVGIGDHLFKRSYFEPHWQQRRGQVLAFEKVTLYGLLISEKRRVSYGRINPREAREIFIRSALVEGRFRTGAKFFRHNQEIMAELDGLESKSRRRDILADEQVLYDFYDERLPEQIHSAVAFNKWCRSLETKQPKLLFIARERLLQRDVSDISAERYPETLQWQDLSFQLHYRFEPGHPEDGVTAMIPIGVLNRLPMHLFEWLVPGLLREKCITLVKSLAKHLRKNFVPVPDYVDKALALLSVENKPLVECLAHQLTRLSGVQIPPDGWQEACLDDYYRMNFKVLNGEGEVLGQGRDLAALVDQFRDQVKHSLKNETQRQFQQSGLTEWSFNDLPDVYTFKQAGINIKAYPSLVDKGESVAIALCDYAVEARETHRRGIVRLLMLSSKQQVKYLQNGLLKDNRTVLQYRSLCNRDELLEDVIPAIFNAVFLENRSLPRSRSDFQALLNGGRQALISQANDYERLLTEIFAGNYLLEKALKKQHQAAMFDSFTDIQEQLAQLIYRCFVYDTPYHWLKQYPRYFQAIQQRLDKMSGQVQKDKSVTVELRTFTERIQQKLQGDAMALVKDPELATFRWMIEEYRVSLFAQALGTQMPVSAKRLEKQWQKVS